MDVVYTLQKDFEHEKDEYKKNQISSQHKYETKVKLAIKQREEQIIKEML